MQFKKHYQQQGKEENQQNVVEHNIDWMKITHQKLPQAADHRIE